MLDRLIERRDTLKEELEKGNQLVKTKEAELADLRSALQRITGAIEVIEETIEEMKKEESEGRG